MRFVLTLGFSIPSLPLPLLVTQIRQEHKIVPIDLEPLLEERRFDAFVLLGKFADGFFVLLVHCSLAAGWETQPVIFEINFLEFALEVLLLPS